MVVGWKLGSGFMVQKNRNEEWWWRLRRNYKGGAMPENRFLPPSSGRRWRAAPEVGSIFLARPTPCPSGIPLPKEGDRWLTQKEPNP